MISYYKVRKNKFKLRNSTIVYFRKELNQNWICEEIPNFKKCKECNEPTCFYSNGFYCLSEEYVVALKGYAWDGASSWFARNTQDTMRATLIHDALYQSMREGVIKSIEPARKWADSEFNEIMKADGMHPRCRTIWHLAVRFCGKKHARLLHGIRC